MFIHSPVDGHFGGFHFWLLGMVLLCIHVPVFVSTPVFNCSRYTPRNGIDGSYGNSMVNLN